MYTLYSEGSDVLLKSETSSVWYNSSTYPTTPEEQVESTGI